jgi:hypothetical protein
MHVFVVKKFSVSFSLSKLAEIIWMNFGMQLICNSSDDDISDSFDAEKYKITKFPKNVSFVIPYM